MAALLCAGRVGGARDERLSTPFFENSAYGRVHLKASSYFEEPESGTSRFNGPDDLSSHKESSGADDEDQDRKQRFMAAKAGERESLRNQAVALVLYVSCCPCLTSSCVPGADVLHAALGAKEAAAALLKAYRQYTLAGCHQRGYPMSTHAAETPLFPCLLHIHVSISSVFYTENTCAHVFAQQASV